MHKFGSSSYAFMFIFQQHTWLDGLVRFYVPAALEQQGARVPSMIRDLSKPNMLPIQSFYEVKHVRELYRSSLHPMELHGEPAASIELVEKTREVLAMMDNLALHRGPGGDRGGFLSVNHEKIIDTVLRSVKVLALASAAWSPPLSRNTILELEDAARHSMSSVGGRGITTDHTVATQWMGIAMGFMTTHVRRMLSEQ